VVDDGRLITAGWPAGRFIAAQDAGARRSSTARARPAIREVYAAIRYRKVSPAVG
jgi:hypothetical protein